MEARADRAPKRLRRNKDVPAYDAPVDLHARRAMHGSNPLSRKSLKKDAKKARRIAQRTLKAQAGAGAGMEVDDGLEGTFMVAT